MSVPASPQATLPALVDLAAQIERDQQRPRATLRRRDRRIGQTLSQLHDRPTAQLLTWVERVPEAGWEMGEAAGAGGEPRPGRHVEHGLRLITLTLGVVGLAVGWATAAGVFYYNGSQPVNVVNVLAVFVGAQLVLLSLWLVAALPRRWLQWVPGAVSLQDSLALLSPGRLGPLIARLLPQSTRAGMGHVLGLGHGHQQVYGGVHKWTIVGWAQGFAVAFNVGALSRFLQLVFFSDLAFAWSTTLRIDPPTVHRIAAALAWPWGRWLEQASPSLELVQKTQYYRLSQAVAHGGAAAGEHVNAAVFGGWWPFVLLCMLAYGLTPRVLTLVFARWRRWRAVREAVLHTPGAAQVLERLNNEFVQTRAQASQPTPAQRAGPRGEGSDPAEAPSLREAAGGRVRVVINWAGVPLGDEAAAALAGGVGEARGRGRTGGASAQASAAGLPPVFHAGGGRNLGQDQVTIEKVGAAVEGGSASAGGVVMLVKSWEPPMLESADFVADLREAVGRGTSIVVVPVALDEAGDLIPPEPSHLGQWRRRMAAAGDPWLVVAVLEEAVAR